MERIVTYETWEEQQELKAFWPKELEEIDERIKDVKKGL